MGPASWAWVLALAASALAAVGAGSGSTLSLVSLASVDPLAVCADGTPAAYYWRRATGNATLWIVDLQGGGWCYSESSCRSRCYGSQTRKNGTSEDKRCSSSRWEPKVQVAGLLGPNADPRLQGANKVWVRYCTSDAHMADTQAFGFHFRGARVVQAVLRDLVVRRGLGAGPGRNLLIFSGQSAGSRGAMIHLDYMPEMLGSDAAANVEVVGVLDSPLWIDEAPFPGGAHFVGFGAMTRSFIKYANVTHLGDECVAHHPGNSRWKCVFGEYRLPYIRTPYLLIASQYDSHQLSSNFGPHWWPERLNELDYASELAARTAALAVSLRAKWNRTAPRQNAVFSWACYTHAITLTTFGYEGGTCRGATVDDALKQFLGFLPDSEAWPSPLLWLDNCTGFACGAGCHPVDRPESSVATRAAGSWLSVPWLLVCVLRVLVHRP